MITLLLHLLRVLPFLVGGHRQLALENLALRQQLAVYRRTVARPRSSARRTACSGSDWPEAWTGWRSGLLVIVSPDTVLRWQRRRFREYWAQLSGRPTRGRPRVNAEIAVLVRKMAAANPLWGAPRIARGTPEARVSMSPSVPSPGSCRSGAPSPLRPGARSSPNHVPDLVSIDFVTVPTARLRVLFVVPVENSVCFSRLNFPRQR